jgi:hypothetical protein
MPLASRSPAIRKVTLVNNTSHQPPWRRRLAAAGLALAGLVGAASAIATTAQASPTAHPAATAGAPQIIHLVAHETQHKFFNNGGFGDEAIFRGILDNAAGTTRVGIFAGTLTSVSANDSLNLATVDLQLPGGQITVQGFFFGTQSPIVHAVTGGTGAYIGAEGEFSFTEPSAGVLDMTLTLLGADQQIAPSHSRAATQPSFGKRPIEGTART